MNKEELVESLELFSHKLKNPLHSIGIHVDVLKSRIKKSPGCDGKAMEQLNFVSSESERLQRIVLKYLEYIKLPEKARQKTDLKKILEG